MRKGVITDDARLALGMPLRRPQQETRKCGFTLLLFKLLFFGCNALSLWWSAVGEGSFGSASINKERGNPLMMKMGLLSRQGFSQQPTYRSLSYLLFRHHHAVGFGPLSGNPAVLTVLDPWTYI